MTSGWRTVAAALGCLGWLGRSGQGRRGGERSRRRLPWLQGGGQPLHEPSPVRDFAFGCVALAIELSELLERFVEQMADIFAHGSGV